MAAGLAIDEYFCGTEGGQLINSFGDGQVYFVPSTR